MWQELRTLYFHVTSNKNLSLAVVLKAVSTIQVHILVHVNTISSTTMQNPVCYTL